MSDIDRERVRREAADAVAAKPPGASDERIEAAMQRYVGASVFEMIKREKGRGDQATKGSAAPGRTDRP